MIRLLCVWTESSYVLRNAANPSYSLDVTSFTQFTTARFELTSPVCPAANWVNKSSFAFCVGAHESPKGCFREDNEKKKITKMGVIWGCFPVFNLKSGADERT